MIKYLILVSLFSFSILACQNKTESKENKPVIEKTDNTGPEYTSRYICPMYCKGSGADTMGICPVCGMDYELNPEFKGSEL
ncbi:MAG: hypothetical protein IPH93_12810 [Saprospiraceae bacterium]|nr:hypothetical protein [Saprospiraceae bacterium]MBK7810654.1 hypothetical protein [Saprospiraceae bacterium]MBK9631444.1 hypothetical protein [Saprospiraceae bacterium]